MTNVVSISSLKRPGAIPVYLYIQHVGRRSVVTLIDPMGWHTFDLTAKQGRALEASQKARLGDEPAAIIEFLLKLKLKVKR